MAFEIKQQHQETELLLLGQNNPEQLFVLWDQIPKLYYTPKSLASTSILAMHLMKIKLFLQQLKFVINYSVETLQKTVWKVA